MNLIEQAPASRPDYRIKLPHGYDICSSCGSRKTKKSPMCRACRGRYREPIKQPTDPFIRHISLTWGQVAIVDTHLYDWLIGLCGWQAQWNCKTRSFYAVGYVDKHAISMHRLILGLATGDPRQGDHENSGTTLDNRGCNLRISKWAQNAKNRRLNRDNTSGFKGVSRYGRRYVAQIKADGVLHYLGRFDTPEHAHRVYCEAAIRLHGKFANLGS